VEKETLKTKDIIVSGLALFAVFFGAGNLVLPPYIGINAGKAWVWAWIGFTLSGSGLTFLTMVAMAKNQGNSGKFGERVGRRFSIILGMILTLCIGPLVAVPRTAATTFEVSISPFFSNFNPILFSVIFFGITLYFAINKSKIVDIIGNYLTPVLLIILIFIILKGIFTPIEPTTVVGEGQFSLGFVQGYHTTDPLIPVIMASVIIANFKRKGIKSKQRLTTYTIYSALIATIGLALIYGGLTYVGSKMFPVVEKGLGRSELLNTIAYYLLGGYGNLALGIVVALACLTTSIGLTTATGDFFSKITNNKLKYEYVVIMSVLISCVLSIIGVDGIMKFSEPVLLIIYPVVIVLGILNIFDKYIKSDLVYKSTIYFTLGVSLLSGIEALGFENSLLVRLMSNLPLWRLGFGWISAALIGLVVAKIICYFLIEQTSTEEEII